MLHQGAGIPMGDPISPGMAIIVLAWMEKEWLQTLTAYDKQHFCAARFMDDILMFVRKAPRWDHERFLADFARSECYHPPLSLVDAKDNTFLDSVDRLKSGDTSIGRAAPPSSSGELPCRPASRRCIPWRVTATSEALYLSALQKLDEFRRLAYPTSVLRGACTYMAACTSCYAWIRVRHVVDAW